VLISNISSFLQEVLCPVISDTKHELLQFLLAVKFGSNLPEKQGVMESGSRISYTKTLEEQTLVYLSVSPPCLSMMLVWNKLADPDL